MERLVPVINRLVIQLEHGRNIFFVLSAGTHHIHKATFLFYVYIDTAF